MKLEKQHGRSVGLENFSKESFGIDEEDMGHIVSIISDQLYSDKPLAVVREYMCNAVDANVEAGRKDTPIEVTLPTKLDPILKIRDFGNGLSTDAVKKHYIRYGKSSKRESNDQIGAFGIGCKAGFCYSDAFTIASTFNGERTTYTAQRGDDGTAFLVNHGSKKTNDPSGMEIAVAINDSDVNTFRKKVFNVAKFFNPVPVMINGEDFEANETVVSGDGFHILDFGDQCSSYYAVALMGNVAYPINASSIPDLTHEQKKVLGSPSVCLVFDLGEISISPDRESLQYTKGTIRAIKQKVDKVRQTLRDKIQETVNEQDNVYDAGKLLSSSMRSVRRIVDSSSIFKYKGKDIYSTFPALFQRADGSFYLSINTHHSPDGAELMFAPRYYEMKFVKWGRNNYSSGIYAEGIMYVEGDNTSCITRKLRKAQQDSGGKKKKAVVMDVNNPFFKEWASLFDWDDFKKGADILTASKMEYDKSVSVASKGRSYSRSGTPAFVLKDYPHSISSDCWDGANEDDLSGDTKFYVPILRYKVQISDGNEMSPRQLIDINKKIGFKESVYGIRVSDVSKLDDTWKPLFDELKERRSSLIKGVIKKHGRHNIALWAKAEPSLNSTCLSSRKGFSFLSECKPFDDLITKHNIVQKVSKDVEALASYDQLPSIKTIEAEIKSCVKISVENIYDIFNDLVRNKFPMFGLYLENRHIWRGMDEEDYPKIIDYIKNNG